MCFRMLVGVDYLGDPDKKTEFSVFQGPGPIDMRAAENQVSTAGRLWMHNAIVAAVLEESQQYASPPQVLTDPGQLQALPERSLLFCSIPFARFVRPDVCHPEQIYSTLDVRITNTPIVLQLEDFSFVAQYSFGPVRGDKPLEPGCILRKELRIKFGLKSTQGVVYQLNDWPSEEMLRSRIQ